VCKWHVCDPVHGPVNGTSSKGPDNETIPLCRVCHEMQTQIGWRRFEIAYHVDRKATAAHWWGIYQMSRRRI
jgi:hypothetical protein